MPESFDAIVVGAGFGGLGAALHLAEQGARVCVCEALTYPGGCASTFRRGGRAYEAGATLFSGLGDGQLFGQWIARHRLGDRVEVDWLDPVVLLRGPCGALPVWRDRTRFVDSLCALPNAPIEALRGFFGKQRRVAETLWTLFDDPALLPPFNALALRRHAARALRYAPLAGLVGRTLSAVVDDEKLWTFKPFDTWVRAMCQITVQCPPEEVEAPFALGALDYPWRGTGHVRGGIGVLASGLSDALRGLGAQVRFADRVASMERGGSGWRVTTRRGVLDAPVVLANLLPTDLARCALLDLDTNPRLRRLDSGVRTGWGAAMQYLTLAPAVRQDEQEPRHLELVDDADTPFIEGNHVFVSIGAPDASGRSSATVSTHVRPIPVEPVAEYHTRVQARMRQTLLRRAPEIVERILHHLPGSPRTFERFTGRSGGYVGGIPRRAGLGNYRDLGPFEAAPGLFLVGDTTFPGQSTLATALGGQRAAVAALRHLAGEGYDRPRAAQ
jgi:phytoene dehydrogenase-like protein